MSRKLKSGEPGERSPSFQKAPRTKSGSEGLRAKAGPDAGQRSAKGASASGEASPGRDAILIHGVSQDGETMAVLRARDDRVEAGVLRAVKAGQPIAGEVLKLTPRPEFPLLCDVEVQLAAGTLNAAGGSDAAQPPSAASSRGRPAQVATDTYRENWDAIWRKPGKKALAN